MGVLANELADVLDLLLGHEIADGFVDGVGQRMLGVGIDGGSAGEDFVFR